MEPIAIYLNALVDMLNENPPVTPSQLTDALKVFKVLGYGYSIDCRLTSEVDFAVMSIKIYNDTETYMFKQFEEFEGAWGFSQ